MNQQNGPLPVGSWARKSIASASQRSWVQLPYRPEFFQYLLSLLLIISSVHYFEVHSRIHFPHCFLKVPKGADKDNLLNNRDLFYFVIISFILTTLMCDSGAILLGEIRNSSPFGLKGLTCQHYELVDGWHLQKLNFGFSKWCQEGFILKQRSTFFP